MLTRLTHNSSIEEGEYDYIEVDNDDELTYVIQCLLLTTKP